MTSRGPRLSDLALAVVLAVIGVVGTVVTGTESGADRPVDAIAIALVLVAALAVSVRRRWPVVTLGLAAVAVSVFLVLGYAYGPIFFPFFVAIYTIARYRPLPTALGWSLAALVLLIPHLFTHESAVAGLLGIIPGSAWVVVPFAIGISVRFAREAREREQAQAVRQRVYDERLRIAQEVHDIVGHGLAAIKMQADIALHVLAKKPEQAEQALAAISRTSTEALDEVRATLAVVRHDDADQAPTMGLHRLDEIRQRMRDAGVEVEVDTVGQPRELPAAVDLTGYRVVQESLTNVLRHGESKTATVRVAYDTNAVSITISNPAPNTATDRTGLGIPGMAERVTALGGEFTAGPTGDGRFEVRVTLPTGNER